MRSLSFGVIVLALTVLWGSTGCDKNDEASIPADISGVWTGIFIHGNGTDESGNTLTLTQSGTDVDVDMAHGDPTLFGNWPNWSSSGTYDAVTGTLIVKAGAVDTLTLFFSGDKATGTFVSEAGATTFTVSLKKS